MKLPTTITNGSVTADKESFTVDKGAEPNQTFTLTFTAEEGYKLDTATVNGNTVSVVNGKYTITPTKRTFVYEVNATFVKTETPPEPVEYDTYTINIANSANGTVTAGNGGRWCAASPQKAAREIIHLLTSYF